MTKRDNLTDVSRKVSVNGDTLLWGGVKVLVGEQPISVIENLQGVLDSKAKQVDVDNTATNLQSQIDTKANDVDISAVGKSGEWEDLLNIPTEFPVEYHTHVEADITDLDRYTKSEVDAIKTGLQDSINTKANDADISDVGKSGQYSDLLNKPDLSVLEEVLVFPSQSDFPATGETQKVYIAEDTGYMYRWSGSEYIQLTDQTAIWGNISGSLSNQSDLQNALNAKANDADISVAGKTGSYNDLLDKPTEVDGGSF